MGDVEDAPSDDPGGPTCNSQFAHELIDHKGVIAMVEKYPQEHSYGPEESENNKIWREATKSEFESPDTTIKVPHDLADLIKELRSTYEGISLSGLHNIAIEEVYGRVYITEHDGSESINYCANDCL